MQCPLCESASRVLESRSAETGAAVRRRRRCSGCGHRFTTYERYERSLVVRKRDGRREPFDRAKLRAGLARAAHKRPVSDPQIDALADAVESALVKADGELPSSTIGDLCLAGLRKVDLGAYLQFAGTLPGQVDSILARDPQFAGSSAAGSVRGEGNPLESTA